MTKRYVVLLQEGNDEMDDKFVNDFLDKNGMGWWHWLPHSWLLTDSSGALKVKDISNAVNGIYKEQYNLVIELNPDGDTWYGFGPIAEDKDYFSWLRANWKKE
jgi:hypothetical protein